MRYLLVGFLIYNHSFDCDSNIPENEVTLIALS